MPGSVVYVPSTADFNTTLNGIGSRLHGIVILAYHNGAVVQTLDKLGECCVKSVPTVTYATGNEVNHRTLGSDVAGMVESAVHLRQTGFVLSTRGWQILCIAEPDLLDVLLKHQRRRQSGCKDALYVATVRTGHRGIMVGRPRVLPRALPSQLCCQH